MSEKIDQLNAAAAEMLKAHTCLHDAIEEHDVKMVAYVRATTAVLQASVGFWQKDSATAWDKCEERRLENEALRDLLKQVIADARISGADQVSDQTRRAIHAALAVKGTS